MSQKILIYWIVQSWDIQYVISEAHMCWHNQWSHQGKILCVGKGIKTTMADKSFPNSNFHLKAQTLS